MWSNFVVSVEAVLPLFCLLLVGMAVRRSRLLSEEELRHLNRMVFVIFFPPMMFHNLYGAKLSEAVDHRLLLFGCAAVAVIYAAAVLCARHVTKDPRSQGAVIQGIYRSNFVIMGLPIATNIYGHGNLAVTAMMVSVIVPLYNVLAVVTLEVFRGSRPSPAHVIRNVLTNPLILGAVAGILCMVTGLRLPGVLEDVVEDMSQVGTPMALVVLGASINFKSLRQNSRALLVSVLLRLVVVPGVGLSAAALLGFRDIAFVTLIAMLAAPTAISAFTMAQTMDSDSELTGNCVVLSTALASFTMFFWIFLFKNLGMF